MTRAEADRVAQMFEEIGGFSSVDVRHFGSLDYVQGDPALSPKWEVELWSVNARAGNRDLTTLKNAADVPDRKAAERLARVAKGKATKRDREALARIAAEKALDQE